MERLRVTEPQRGRMARDGDGIELLSQLRRELHDAWNEFHGELQPTAASA